MSIDILVHNPIINPEYVRDCASAHIDFGSVDSLFLSKDDTGRQLLIIRAGIHSVVTATPTSISIRPDPSYVPSVPGVCDICADSFEFREEDATNVCFTCAREEGICRTCGHVGGWAGCAECIPF